jgi:hypothetical protein
MLKYPINQDDRVWIAQLLYHTLVQPETDMGTANKFASMIIRLIRKTYHVRDNAMQLPWRPLFDKLHTCFPLKSSHWTSPHDGTDVGHILQLAETAQRFFEPTAAQEILDMFLPYIQTRHHIPTITAMAWLCRFLPVYSSNTDVTTWLPTLFNLWMNMPRCMEIAAYTLSIIQRVARAHVADTREIFNEKWIDWIYGIILHLFQIPSADANTRNVRPLARFGVYHHGLSKETVSNNYVIGHSEIVCMLKTNLGSSHCCTSHRLDYQTIGTRYFWCANRHSSLRTSNPGSRILSSSI